jgi:lipoprotein-releasing system permease protein
VRLAWSLAIGLLRRRGTSLLRTSAVAALAAVALGVAALVVVVALMSGYREALRRGILAGGGHVVAMFANGLPARQAAVLEPKVSALAGVASVGEVLYLPAMLFDQGGEDTEVVTLKATTLTPSFAPLPPASRSGPLPVAIGRGLASRLRAKRGASLALQVYVGGSFPEVLAVRVTDVFRTGLADLDDRWVSTRLSDLAARLGGVDANGLEVRLVDPDASEEMRARVETVCGPKALVTTWQESNSNLFAALRWQKLSLGVLLSLVVGVGAFEVASALVVLVTEKRRQLGILLALGAEPRLLRRVMLAAGGSLGVLGVAGGLVLGVCLAGLLTALGVPHFSPDIAAIYMVDSIPMHVQLGDLFLIVAVGLVEVALAALLPARRVGRWEPLEVFRWV